MKTFEEDRASDEQEQLSCEDDHNHPKRNTTDDEDPQHACDH